MDPKTVTIPLTLVTRSIKNYAQRASTPNERHYVFALTEELGGEIRQIVPGFSEQEFQKDCGVKPEWATSAA